eukprot:3810096-Amphidinium_carterae.1
MPTQFDNPTPALNALWSAMTNKYPHLQCIYVYAMSQGSYGVEHVVRNHSSHKRSPVSLGSLYLKSGCCQTSISTAALVRELLYQFLQLPTYILQDMYGHIYILRTLTCSHEGERRIARITWAQRCPDSRRRGAALGDCLIGKKWCENHHNRRAGHGEGSSRMAHTLQTAGHELPPRTAFQIVRDKIEALSSSAPL